MTKYTLPLLILTLVFHPLLLTFATSTPLLVLNDDVTNLTQRIASQDLAKLMSFFIQKLVDKSSSNDGFAYNQLRNNSFFENNLKFIKRGLKDIDPAMMEVNERKAFFINAYNILVLDILMSFPDLPEATAKIPEYELKYAYRIGNISFNLGGIKHGILRENSANPADGTKFFEKEIYQPILVPKDPRINFALYRASKRFPPLRSFDSESLEDELNAVTTQMCNEGVVVGDGSSLSINEIFKEYMADFASSEDELLRWLSHCTDQTDKKISLYFAALDKSLLQYSFEPFDDSLNAITIEEEDGRLEVDLFIESLCSDAKEFFLSQLEPAWNNLKNIMKLNIVTFGKASVTPINEGEAFEFECQHGPTECLGNKIMSCVVAFFPIEIQLPFLSCLMVSPSLTKHLKECGKRLGLPTIAVEECSNSIEGSRILYANGLQTLELRPKLFFVPTVTVNKFYNSSLLHQSLKNFPDFICESYTRLSKRSLHDISTPTGCKVKMEVYIESFNPTVQKFFLEQLAPTWRRIGRAMDLQIIPFGNAHAQNNTDVDLNDQNIDCPQGSLECNGNLLMSCIAELLPVQTQIELFVCIFSKRMSPLKGQECARQEGVSWEPLNECTEGFFGKTLLENNGFKAAGLSQKLNKIPTIIINGVNNASFTEWALNDLSALVCDTFLQSDQSEKQISLPTGCPVRVELYLEMLCPDTNRFILKEFYPAWEKISGLIDLHFIPFGKANVWLTERGDDYEFECQNGPLECEGNKMMSCVVEYLPVDLQVEFIACMMKDESPANSGKKCAELLEVSWDPLQTCSKSKEGSKLLFQNGIRTMNLKPTLFFVPTITINGFFSADQLEISLNNFVDQICESYQGPSSHMTKVLTPKGCRLKMVVFFINYSEDSRKFITSQLLPVWQKLYDVIQLELIPVGIIFKDSDKEINLEEVCRKSEECSADLLFSCVKKYVDIYTQVKFLECVLSKWNTSSDAAKQCCQMLQISWDIISKCFKSSKSVDLLQQGQIRKKTLRPTFHSVPTLTLNGYYDKQDLKKSKTNLLEMVCDSFHDPSVHTTKKWKPNGCPVTVEIYLEALCPDTMKFFISQVVPAWNALSTIMDLRIIPFGKASGKQINPDKEEYEFQCQNGPLECHGNKVMSCVVEHYTQDEQVRMLSCMLTRKHPAIEGQQCAEELSLGWSPIVDCLEKQASKLLYKNGLLTQKIKPKLFFVPTTTVNGFYNKMILRQSLRDLLGLVCEFYLQGRSLDDQTSIPDGCLVSVDVYFRDLDDGMKYLFSDEVEEFWRIYKTIVRLRFLPLVKRQNVDEELSCSSSPEKCLQTKMFSCVTEALSTDDQLEYFACLMSQTDPDSAYNMCSKELNVNLEEIKFCAADSKRTEILEANQNRYEKFKKSSMPLPIIVVQKAILRQHSDLRKVTCLSFRGPTPIQCKFL